MAFGKKTDRAGLQAVLELKNVDYSKDPEIQQLYTRLVNGQPVRSDLGKECIRIVTDRRGCGCLKRL